jgi:hydrogenase nickel incorporation protein HypA/HybF
MHELSIAMSIVEIAGEEAKRLRARRVNAVHVKVGALSGVVKDALEFAWQVATDNTPVAGSRLAIEDTAGRELELCALEIEDP